MVIGGLELHHFTKQRAAARQLRRCMGRDLPLHLGGRRLNVSSRSRQPFATAGLQNPNAVSPAATSAAGRGIGRHPQASPAQHQGRGSVSFSLKSWGGAMRALSPARADDLKHRPTFSSAQIGSERGLFCLLTVVRTPFHFSKRAAGEAAEFTRSGVKFLGVEIFRLFRAQS